MKNLFRHRIHIQISEDNTTLNYWAADLFDKYGGCLFDKYGKCTISPNSIETAFAAYPISSQKTDFETEVLDIGDIRYNKPFLNVGFAQRSKDYFNGTNIIGMFDKSMAYRGYDGALIWKAGKESEEKMG